MANIKVSEMPEATSVAPEDLIMLIQGGGNKKVTTNTLLGDSVIVSPTEPVGDDRRKVWFEKGKNLFDNREITQIGINFGTKIDGDNIYSSSQSDSRAWEYENSNWFVNLPAGTYTISLLYSKQSTSNNAGIGVYSKNGQIFFKSTGNLSSYDYTFTLVKETLIGIMMKIYDGIFKLQIEQGSKATQYETYIEPHTYIKNNNDVYEEFVKKQEEVYSIEEVKVGTWINGKPLYRKVLINTLPKVVTENTTVTKKFSINANVKTGFIGGAFYYNNKDNQIVPIPFILAGGQVIKAYMGLEDGSITLASNTAYTNDQQVTIIVYYTKTTD